MSNLFSYFQRIEPKKMATTTANDESIRQANNTPKHDNNGTIKKNQTPKASSSKSMNMNDVYSSDTPKSEKRKQSSTIATDDNETLPKNKSTTDISIIKTKIMILLFVERKTLNARNKSEDEDEDEPQLKIIKVMND
jgi:hypothetical protein